jgi:hypothetical protein
LCDGLRDEGERPVRVDAWHCGLYAARVFFLVAGVVGFVFGAGDQYLGSLFLLGPWTSTVSGMSAPWLVLPFAFGATQAGQRRAMLTGLTAVMCALAGYFVMTLSPLESVPPVTSRRT